MHVMQVNLLFCVVPNAYLLFDKCAIFNKPHSLICMGTMDMLEHSKLACEI